jgi:enoyl-CoA hydratase/carnithine racemase
MAAVERRIEAGVATVLLNRPERKNAFTLEMVDAWADTLQWAQDHDEVRAIVVTGAGDAFCSGVDLDDFAAHQGSVLDNKRLLMERVHRVPLTLETIDKPVIAAVNGAAVGAGMDVALMCDIRFASGSARFSEGYVRVGLVPGDGGCFLLPRLVGVSTALRLLWTGDFVAAEEALRIRLVDSVVDDDALLDEACCFARRLAHGPTVAIRMIKRAVRQSEGSDLRSALDLISSHMAVVQSTRDSQEAMAAFREGRTPVFEGR